MTVHILPLQVSEAMSGDATADDDTDRRKRRSRSLDPTDSDSTGDSAGEEGGAAKVPLAAALEAAAEPPAGRCPCPATACSILVSSLHVARVPASQHARLHSLALREAASISVCSN